jgi:hypothetical protein
MKLHKVKKRTAEPQNIPPRRIESSSGGQVSKGGIASGFAFGYDPTGRSVIFLKQTVRHRSSRRAEYINSMFDLPAMP